MSNILVKIEEKIKHQNRIQMQIGRIDLMISLHSHILSPEEILDLEKKKLDLKSKLINENLSFEEKNKDFIYNLDEIQNCKPISWIIEGFIPSTAIGVVYGDSGAGKTAVLTYVLPKILESQHDLFVVYIDADMGIDQIKANQMDRLMAMYGSRFIYAGKGHNITEKAQKLLRDIVHELQKDSTKKYLIIEDSLTLIAKRKNGFIVPDKLYEYERQIRNLGGSIYIIHHLNKQGQIADSQQIINYADYSYFIERNDFNSTILLTPMKISRFDIQPKAFLTQDKKIIKEVKYEFFNISQKETQFVRYILEALEDGELNQSELISHLEKMRFFSEYKVGQKKAIAWLKKWAENGKWQLEQRPNAKNATFYWLQSNADKLQNLQNCQTEEK